MPAIGVCSCHACAREVVVRENPNGALNFSCAHCDLSMYDAAVRRLDKASGFDQLTAARAALAHARELLAALVVQVCELREKI